MPKKTKNKTKNSSCVTGKVRYRDEISAMLGLASTHSKGRDEARYYRCPSCHGFHLSSKSKRGSIG